MEDKQNAKNHKRQLQAESAGASFPTRQHRPRERYPIRRQSRQQRKAGKPMNSITITDVRRVAAMVGDMARQLEITDAYPVLEEGSVTYGRAYRLMTVAKGTSGHGTPRLNSWPSSGYLGMTKSEAFDSLQKLKSALFDIAETSGKHIDFDRCLTVADAAEKAKYVSWQLWTDVAPWKITTDAV